MTITAHLHKYKIFSIIIFKTFKPKSELYDPAELLLDYTEPRRKRSSNEVRRSMHESQNKLAEKSFSKVEYFMIFFYKYPLLVDYHETNLKIQTKRDQDSPGSLTHFQKQVCRGTWLDQDKLERRYLLTTEE